MGIITKGIKGILTISKKSVKSKFAYREFLETLSIKNGVKYTLITEGQKDAIEKAWGFVSGELKDKLEDYPKDRLANVFYQGKTSPEFAQEIIKKEVQDVINNLDITPNLKTQVKNLLDKKDLSDNDRKNFEKQLERLEKRVDARQSKYVLKIEELVEAGGQTWDQHASGTSIVGLPRSSWFKGCSYSTKRNEMLAITSAGTYNLTNVPYGKWIVLRDYQGFVPNNGMGTYTIRNIKKKDKWKQITI